MEELSAHACGVGLVGRSKSFRPASPLEINSEQGLRETPYLLHIAVASLSLSVSD